MFVDNLVNTSSGVSKLRAFLGLLFSKVSTLSISLEVVSKKLCVLGKYCLTSPFVCSFKPLSQEW
ncbi:hypothetical protein, partial [Candidatus Rhabdochlamydia sp. W815]|uniref:hypothetical protein n=1 Tax=Candidatus Rhabdochlamydia sp. W815 TaxID=2720721 RepID=UPI001BFCBF40